MIFQLAIYGLISGAVYALIALSFSIIYSSCRFFHFAHAAIISLGAYICFLFYSLLKFDFFLSLLFSLLSIVIIGFLINRCIYLPIRKHHGTPLILLIASLGIYVIIQNLISLFFGDGTKSIRSGEVKQGLEFLGAYITPIQIVIIVSAIILTIITWLLINYTYLGKASRAIANNPNLSEIFGIKKEKIYNFVFAYGSALAAIAGILIALDTDMTPTMGFRPLMMGIIAVIIGGVGSIPGIVLGALFLGFSQNFAAWFLPSQWQDAIAFAIMLIFLLFRPQGFFGKPLKKAEI